MYICIYCTIHIFESSSSLLIQHNAYDIYIHIYIHTHTHIHAYIYNILVSTNTHMQYSLFQSNISTNFQRQQSVIHTLSKSKSTQIKTHTYIFKDRQDIHNFLEIKSKKKTKKQTSKKKKKNGKLVSFKAVLKMG